MRPIPCLFLITLAACNPGVIVLDGGNDGGAIATDGGTSGDGGPGNSGVSPPVDTSTTDRDTDTDTDTTTGDDAATFGDDDTSDTGAAFIVPADGGICAPVPGAGYLAHCQCDVLAQDCPSGEKCAPWANDGGSHWNATRCSPIERNPAQIGESCTTESSPYSGIDDCAFGAMCWGVDPDTLEGTCVPLCTGGEAAPQCPDALVCAIAGQGAVTVCLPPCDPLASDCPAGELCSPFEERFVCTDPVVETAGQGEACTVEYGCEPGHFCVAGDVVGCDEPGCCTAMCNLADADPEAGCPDQSYTCLPLYEDGRAPEGLQDLGVCSLGG